MKDVKDLIKKWLGLDKMQSKLDDITPSDEVEKWIANNVYEAVEEIFTDGITDRITKSVHYSQSKYDYLNGKVKMLTNCRINDAVSEAIEYHIKKEEFIDSLIDKLNRKQLK